MSDDPSDRASSDAEGPDRRQLAFSMLAAVALVLAAFLAPPVAGPQPGDGPDVGSFDGGADQRPDDGDGGTDVPISIWTELLRLLLELVGVTGGQIGDGDGGHTCSIALDSDPFPGASVTVLVTYDGEPLADAPVWFNDRRVGRTDADGTVSGEVPYVRELVIRVGVENRPDCRTRAGKLGTTDGTGTTDDAAAGRSVPSGRATFGRFAPVGVATAQESSSDPTATYSVDADASVVVLERPFPGETVAVVARLDDQPFPNASLSVNGETVGRTDATGRARIEVPDDGTEELRVRVQRGEFAATTTVDVLLLQARLVPVGLAAVPGAEAAVEATFGGDRLPGATVTVAGTHRGETGPDGRLRVDLPVDPRASVVVTARDQTATTSVVATYWPAVAVLLVVLAGLCLLAYYRWGRRGLAGVLGPVASLLAVVVADAFYGRPGRYAVLGTLATAVAAVAIYRWRRNLAEGAATTTGLLRRIVAHVRTALALLRDLPGRLVALAGALREHLLAGTLVVATMLGGLVDSLRSLPRSGRALVALLVERLRALVDQARRALRTASPIGVALVVVALVATAGAYVLAGRVGLLFVLACLVLAALVWLGRRRLADVATEADTEDAADGSLAAPPIGDLGARTLRTLWRAFARAVVPDRWRTQTPREVATTAVEQGYPRAPVEALTTLFREVEYGRRSLSSAVRERATTAYAAIRDHDRGDEQ